MTPMSQSILSFFPGFNTANIPQSNREGQAVGQIHCPRRPGRHSPQVLPAGAQKEPALQVQSAASPQVQNTSKCMLLMRRYIFLEMN